MASWNSINEEVQQAFRQGDPAAFDTVRRQKIDRVTRLTGRHLVIYAADFTSQNPIKAQIVGPLTSISLMDKDGFDEVTRNLTKEQGLDVLLHSPGGSAEATESIVELLRERFTNIRYIIPSCAKSAATMMAMSGNELLMDEIGELGPTDPQMIFNRDNQLIVAPAQAIKDQFETAQKDINGDPNRLPGWLPILREFAPALLAVCDNQLALSETLVSTWLEKYMFDGEADAATNASRIAKYLSTHNNFRSHSRRVGINDLQREGVKVLDLRTQPELHEAVRDLYTALILTFNTGTYKVFENSQREALFQQLQMQPPEPPPQQVPQPHTSQPKGHKLNKRR